MGIKGDNSAINKFTYLTLNSNPLDSFRPITFDN